MQKLIDHLRCVDTANSKKETPAPTRIYTKHPSTFPAPSQSFWGKSVDKKSDESITAMDPMAVFSSDNQDIDIMRQTVDLWLKSNAQNRFHHSVKTGSSHWEMLSKMKGIGYGIDFEDFYRLVTYWKCTFSLDSQLQKLIAFHHYKTTVQGLSLHFIKETGTNLDAASSTQASSSIDAVLCLHGWPGSFWEFHKMIKPLKQRLSPSTDIIVPSLPGFVFSEYPTASTQFNMIATAAIFKEFMERRLGYKSYIISAGDFGAAVAQCLGFSASLDSDADRKVSGILLHDTFTTSRDLDEDSTINLKEYKSTIYKLLHFTGYQHIQCERPNTLGIALESSPVAVLAWIYEMYLNGSDGPLSVKEMKYEESGRRVIGGQVNWDDVIFTAMLYWLNGRVTTSLNWYADNLKLFYVMMRKYYMPRNVKIGLVYWPNSMGDPRSHKYHFRNIVYTNREKKGGHFSALERPAEYVVNIERFMQAV